MADIPEHLIDAVYRVHGGSLDVRKGTFAEQMIAAVLAALRPEDAHLVPAWKADLAYTSNDWQTMRANRGQALVARAERDEARAEVERLKAKLRRSAFL